MQFCLGLGSELCDCPIDSSKLLVAQGFLSEASIVGLSTWVHQIIGHAQAPVVQGSDSLHAC